MKFKEKYEAKQFLVERVGFKSIAIASMTFFKRNRTDFMLNIYDTTVKRYIESFFKNDIQSVMTQPIFQLTSTLTPELKHDIELSFLPVNLLTSIDQMLNKDKDIAKNIVPNYASKKVKEIVDFICNYISTHPKEIISINA